MQNDGFLNLKMTFSMWIVCLFNIYFKIQIQAV